MSAEATPPSPVIREQYANRRLYNTQVLTYMPTADIQMMIRQQRPFVVSQMPDGRDITNSVPAWVQGVLN